MPHGKTHGFILEIGSFYDLSNLLPRISRVGIPSRAALETRTVATFMNNFQAVSNIRPSIAGYLQDETADACLSESSADEKGLASRRLIYEPLDPP